MKGGCNSSPESTGISMILDVSCKSAWDSAAFLHELGLSQVDKTKQERFHLLGA